MDITNSSQFTTNTGTNSSRFTFDADNVIYYGDEDTDGTWRIIPDGNNLVSQRRESGTYVTKQTITP